MLSSDYQNRLDCLRKIIRENGSLKQGYAEYMLTHSTRCLSGRLADAAADIDDLLLSLLEYPMDEAAQMGVIISLFGSKEVFYNIVYTLSICEAIPEKVYPTDERINMKLPEKHLLYCYQLADGGLTKLTCDGGNCMMIIDYATLYTGNDVKLQKIRLDFEDIKDIKMDCAPWHIRSISDFSINTKDGNNEFYLQLHNGYIIIKYADVKVTVLAQ